MSIPQSSQILQVIFSRNSRAFRWLIISCFLFAGCQQSHKRQIRPGPHALWIRDTLQVGDTIRSADGDIRLYEPTDTTFIFRVRDTLVAFITTKSEREMFKPFQAYVDTHPTLASEETHLEVIDVTGDGIPDTCISHVRFTDSTMFVNNIVNSGGAIIWRDSSTICSEGVAGSDWMADSETYAAMMPWSFHFMQRTRFVGDVIDTSVDYERDYYRNFLEGNAADSTRWRAYFAGHTIRTIWTIALVSNSDMIWDEKTHQFICYICP